jgi:hypothetical protein
MFVYFIIKDFFETGPHSNLYFPPLSDTVRARERDFFLFLINLRDHAICERS